MNALKMHTQRLLVTAGLVAGGFAWGAEPPATLTLLPLMNHVPSERVQRVADCYAWSATAAMEIALSANYGIRDRLSLQYFHEHFHAHTRENPIDANDLYQVVRFYNAQKVMVPWSNPNAHYQPMANPRPSVHTLPHYTIRHLSSVDVLGEEPDAYSMMAGQMPVNDIMELMITRIKETLVARKAVLFNNGHYMTIVGYNAEATDPAKHYWIMLNSYGNTPPRAEDGTEHLLMRANPMIYTGKDAEGRRYRFEAIGDFELDLQPLESLQSAVLAPPGPVQAGSPVTLVASVTGRPPVTYRWFKNGTELPSATQSTLTIPAVAQGDAASYSVEARNTAGTVAMSQEVILKVEATPSPLAIHPARASMGAGCTRTFTARLHGTDQAASGLTWNLASHGGTGHLENAGANPVTLTVTGPGQLVLTARTDAAPNHVQSVHITVKSLDFNGDGRVDVLDLARMAQAYGTRTGDHGFNPAVDLNDDGQVDAEDLRDFLSQFDR